MPARVAGAGEENCRSFSAFLDELEQLIVGNEIVIARTQNVGKLSPELAISAGITGPMLRACGVNYDVRKVDGYGFYPRFKFRVPLGEHGDTYDRLMMRVLEMRESVGILQQAFEQVPAGPIMNPKVKIRAFRPPVGEAYGRIEGPKGELGFYLISDGSTEPVSLSRAPAEFHQSDRARRHVPRAYCGRRDGNSRQHRYRDGRSGSITTNRSNASTNR